MKASTLKRFLRLPRFDEHMELHRIDCLAVTVDLDLYDFVAEKLRTTPPEEIRPEPLLTGRELDRAWLRAGTAVQGDSGGGGRCAA